MAAPSRDPGSFRDPAGTVYRVGGRIFRTISDKAAADYVAARDSGVLRRHVASKALIDSQEVDPADFAAADGMVRFVVEHPPLPFFSYPYEWPFALLQAAALLHLDLQCSLLDEGFVLSDASAYNIQFDGVAPVFIDLLSIRQYRDGEYWLAHDQFCQQFLNPLLLRAWLGVPHNDWLRGRLEGIRSGDLVRLLPVRRILSLRVLAHVLGPARLQARSERRLASRIGRTPLPRTAYRALLTQLRRWIASLRAGPEQSQWQQYDGFHTYSGAEERAKQEFVRQFVAEHRPGLLWDLGCNTGEYAELALGAGAGRVIGLDVDHGALDRAVTRARDRQLRILPLYLDAANPSPDQGWWQRERAGLCSRRNADALIALAFLHHLVIGRNIPLGDAVAWLVQLAPRGVIEFVQKDDPTVRLMLALREDIFDRYNESEFLCELEKYGRIMATRRNDDNGRLLVAYERIRKE